MVSLTGEVTIKPLLNSIKKKRKLKFFENIQTIIIYWWGISPTKLPVFYGEMGSVVVLYLKKNGTNSFLAYLLLFHLQFMFLIKNTCIL